MPLRHMQTNVISYEITLVRNSDIYKILIYRNSAKRCYFHYIYYLYFFLLIFAPFTLTTPIFFFTKTARLHYVGIFGIFRQCSQKWSLNGVLLAATHILASFSPFYFCINGEGIVQLPQDPTYLTTSRAVCFSYLPACAFQNV